MIHRISHPLQQSVGAKLESVKKKVSVPFGGLQPKKPVMPLGPQPGGKGKIAGLRSQSLAMGLMNISANMGAVSFWKNRAILYRVTMVFRD